MTIADAVERIMFNGTGMPPYENKCINRNWWIRRVPGRVEGTIAGLALADRHVTSTPEEPFRDTVLVVFFDGLVVQTRWFPDRRGNGGIWPVINRYCKETKRTQVEGVPQGYYSSVWIRKPAYGLSLYNTTSRWEEAETLTERLIRAGKDAAVADRLATT